MGWDVRTGHDIRYTRPVMAPQSNAFTCHFEQVSKRLVPDFRAIKTVGDVSNPQHHADLKYNILCAFAKVNGEKMGEFDSSRDMTKLRMSCHYCGYFPRGDLQSSLSFQDSRGHALVNLPGDPKDPKTRAMCARLNTLGREDPMRSFGNTNTLAVCDLCKYMQSLQTEDTFIDHVRRICKYQGIQGIQGIQGLDDPEAAYLQDPSLIRRSLKREGKDCTVYMSDDEKLDLWCSPCYLCGVSPSYGLDRLDPEGKYDIDNSRPCCSQCSNLRRHIPMDAVRAHIRVINGITEGVRVTKSETYMRGHPVEVGNEVADHLPLVFPNLNIAEMIVGKHKKWKRVHAERYINQTIQPEAAKRIILKLRDIGRPALIAADNAAKAKKAAKAEPCSIM